jgi:hypothetical protein
MAKIRNASTSKSGLASMSEEQRQKARKKALETRRSRAKIKSRFSLMKAIRYKCIDCCAGSKHEVVMCDIKECSLWEYRLGKRPDKDMVEAVQGVPVHGRDI